MISILSPSDGPSFIPNACHFAYGAQPLGSGSVKTVTKVQRTKDAGHLPGSFNFHWNKKEYPHMLFVHPGGFRGTRMAMCFQDEEPRPDSLAPTNKWALSFIDTWNVGIFVPSSDSKWKALGLKILTLLLLKLLLVVVVYLANLTSCLFTRSTNPLLISILPTFLRETWGANQADLKRAKFEKSSSMDESAEYTIAQWAQKGIDMLNVAF